VKSWMRPRIILETIKNNDDLEWIHLANKDEPLTSLSLDSIIDEKDTVYWNRERKNYLYSQMPESHQNWINDNINKGYYSYATAFRRMRFRNGKKQSTAEIRTDGIAGCLRTAKGGSAKQILIISGKGEFQVRLLNEHECARLMGAPEYKISKEISKNDYLFAFGDGVCASAIEWLDRNYLTPIFEAGHYPQYNLNQNTNLKHVKKMLSNSQELEIKKKFEDWCVKHFDHNLDLPIKGRLYGALIVLYNLGVAEQNSEWDFTNTLKVNSTDRGTHFGDRSIKNHTSHRLNLALSNLQRSDLKPTSGGEAGRTSTGTKRAGLGIIQIINSITNNADKESITTLGKSAVDLLNNLVIEQLDQHLSLGGIEIKYQQNETIGAYVSKLINFKSHKPGAILQHLIGAKLELRYKDNHDIKIIHHKSSTADIQTQRLGDFDLGNSVIHVTKSPTIGHFHKAYQNATAGRTTYVLIPENKLGTVSLALDIDENYTNKVNIYSIEQFISQNIDEMSLFQKEISLDNLKQLLQLYNDLINKFENDPSLKIIIPDFGI
ncbi:MAG: DUF4928 family protein, partial [Bacteroidota bacterium]